MRFDIILSITFLATIAAGLVIPANLNVRNDLEDDSIFKREPKKSEAKKARIAAAGVARNNAKAANRIAYGHAAQAYHQTVNLPNRHSTYHIPGAPASNGNKNKADNHGAKPTYNYSGKEVRKAVFDSHLAPAHGGIPHRLFSNYDHRVPQPHGPSKPLPGMTVDRVTHMPGREFSLPNRADTRSRTRSERKADKRTEKTNPKAAKKAAKKAAHAAQMASNPGPARVITQEIPGQPGHHSFMGVIAHDQTRTNSHKTGYNDHFEVLPS